MFTPWQLTEGIFTKTLPALLLSDASVFIGLHCRDNYFLLGKSVIETRIKSYVIFCFVCKIFRVTTRAVGCLLCCRPSSLCYKCHPMRINHNHLLVAPAGTSRHLPSNSRAVASMSTSWWHLIGVWRLNQSVTMRCMRSLVNKQLFLAGNGELLRPSVLYIWRLDFAQINIRVSLETFKDHFGSLLVDVDMPLELNFSNVASLIW